MKKVSRQKLALAAETIRSLTPANLGAVAGGVIVVVTTTTNTTHSILTVCGPVTTTLSSVSGGSSIAE
jgi:hypothetical protein